MFSEAQLEAIELLAGGHITYKEVAQRVGVDVRTVARWRKDPEFRSEVKHVLYERIGDELPKVFNVLIEKCLDGELRAIKLLLEHMDRIGMIEVGQEQNHIIMWQSVGGEEQE